MGRFDDQRAFGVNDVAIDAVEKLLVGLFYTDDFGIRFKLLGFPYFDSLNCLVGHGLPPIDELFRLISAFLAHFRPNFVTQICLCVL